MKIGVACAAVLALLSSGALAKENSAPPEPATHPDWADAARIGREQIVSSLFDPGSAQIVWMTGFRWGYAKPLIGRRTYGWIACGTLNAKNRMGGYVGAQGFWLLVEANGAVRYAMIDDTSSSCDKGSSVPVNPELVAVARPRRPLEARETARSGRDHPARVRHAKGETARTAIGKKPWIAP
jgi:hypothetical protein